MENHHFQWVNPLYLAIFNSYVKLPEGNGTYPSGNQSRGCFSLGTSSNCSERGSSSKPRLMTLGVYPEMGQWLPQETPFVVEKNKPMVVGGSRPGLEVTLFDNTTHPPLVSARNVWFFLANPSVGFGGHYRMSADICDQHI